MEGGEGEDGVREGMEGGEGGRREGGRGWKDGGREGVEGGREGVLSEMLLLANQHLPTQDTTALILEWGNGSNNSLVN